MNSLDRSRGKDLDCGTANQKGRTRTKKKQDHKEPVGGQEQERERTRMMTTQPASAHQVPWHYRIWLHIHEPFPRQLLATCLHYTLILPERKNITLKHVPKHKHTPKSHTHTPQNHNHNTVQVRGCAVLVPSCSIIIGDINRLYTIATADSKSIMRECDSAENPPINTSPLSAAGHLR